MIRLIQFQSDHHLEDILELADNNPLRVEIGLFKNIDDAMWTIGGSDGVLLRNSLLNWLRNA